MVLNKFEKSLVDEISTLSGYSEVVVREVLELTFLRQLEFVMSNQPVRLPFIGIMNTEYSGDSYDGGNRVANVTCSVDPSDLYRRLYGDIVDGESIIMKEFLDAKTESDLQALLEK